MNKSSQKISKRFLLKTIFTRFFSIIVPSYSIQGCGGGSEKLKPIVDQIPEAVLVPNSVHIIPLTCSLSATLGPSVTFNRIGKGAVIDCYGSLQITRSGEARFMGARRVENLIFDDIFQDGWIKGSGVDKINIPTEIGPYKNRKNVFEFRNFIPKQDFLIYKFKPERLGQYTASTWISGNGNDALFIKIIHLESKEIIASAKIYPKKVKTRYAIYSVLKYDGVYGFAFESIDAGSIFQLACAQLEHTNGQNGAPNDYVSRGGVDDVAPWNYAGVDGVQYFETLNPWHLRSNEAFLGNYTKIDPNQLKGLIIGPTRSNAFKESKDISGSSWFLLNGKTDLTKLDTTLLGPGTLIKFDEIYAFGLHRFQQIWQKTELPIDNSMITVSFFVRYAERKNLSIGFIDKKGVEKRAIIDLSTLKIIDESGDIFKTQITMLGDVLRVSFTDKSGVGTRAPVGFGGLVDDFGREIYQPSKIGGIYVGALSFERTDHACLYLGDTGLSLNSGTGDDLASFGFDSKMGGNNWTVSMETTLMYDSDSPTKSSWSFIWYATQKTNIRWGCAVRPGAYGGAAVEDFIRHPVFDCYAGLDGLGVPQVNPITGQPQEIFDVANVKIFSFALQTVKWQVSLHPVAIENGSNIAMYVGRLRAVLDSNGTHIVNKTPLGVSCTLGAKTVPIDEKSIKNIYVYNKARTWDEMSNNVDYLS